MGAAVQAPATPGEVPVEFPEISDIARVTEPYALQVRPSVSVDQNGALAGDPDPATRFDGSGAFSGTAWAEHGPQVFSQEAWFKTTSTRGGKLIGLGKLADRTS